MGTNNDVGDGILPGDNAMARKGDPETQLDQFHLRTDRMFKKDGYWFFRTREGTVEGPYIDEWEAKTWVDLYVSFIESNLTSLENSGSVKSTKPDKIG